MAYPHVLTNAEYYRQFDTDAKATDYLTKVIASGQLAAMSGPNAELQEITHDERLTKLVNEVYAGFIRVYPNETAGLPTPPRVAIVKSDVVNAFALGPGFVDSPSARRDQSPWLFIVHTALMNRGGTDSELRGLFAHELGHLILRNYLPEVSHTIRSIYKIGASENGVLGEAQTDDPALAAHVEEMLKRQTRVGGLPELGLPVVPSLGSYAKVIDVFVTQALQGPASPAVEACKTAKAKTAELQAAQKALIPGAAEGNDAPRSPTADEAAHFDELGAALGDALRACLAPTSPSPTVTLALLTAGLNQLPDAATNPANPDHAKLIGLMLDAELRVDAEGPTSAPLIDRLLRVQAPVRSELVMLQEDPRFPLDDIRVYDFEEDADDAAVRILAAIGDDPLSIGNFLVDAAMTPEAKASCLANVAAGKPVPYGRFIDTHPATCWRYYHAVQFAKALKECQPQAALERSMPKGSGLPSVSDKAPSEVIEKGYGKGQR
jgi:hypothetical protein